MTNTGDVFVHGTRKTRHQQQKTQTWSERRAGQPASSGWCAPEEQASDHINAKDECRFYQWMVFRTSLSTRVQGK